MAKGIRRWWIRARLAELWSPHTLASVAAVLLGLSVWAFGIDNTTAALVHVAGYDRADGTHVGSYSRRPPGSREHDALYESLESFALLIAAFGVISGWRPLSRFVMSSDWDLLPPLPGTTNLLAYPTGLEIPSVAAKARKRAHCVGCASTFEVGSVYWYAQTSAKRSKRQRFCDSCRAATTAKAAQYRRVSG